MAGLSFSSVCPTLRQLAVLKQLTRYSAVPCHSLDIPSQAKKPNWRWYTTDTAAQDTSTAKKMTFEEYRKLKKNLKLRSRLAGLPLGFGGIVLASFINVQLNPHMFEMSPEEAQQHLILGMDPIMVAAISGLASGVVCYFIGGALFTATWRLIARNQSRELEQRDVDFLERLQRHRFSDVNKYEDDYYGDKVVTPSDYRQWIRQQQKRKERLQATQLANTQEGKT